MIAESLEKIADHVLSLDETGLSELLNHYKNRISQSEPNRAWERAVIAFFLLNGIRMKNSLKKSALQRRQLSCPQKPQLYLVKA